MPRPGMRMIQDLLIPAVLPRNENDVPVLVQDQSSWHGHVCLTSMDLHRVLLHYSVEGLWNEGIDRLFPSIARKALTVAVAVVVGGTSAVKMSVPTWSQSGPKDT